MNSLPSSTQSFLRSLCAVLLLAGCASRPPRVSGPPQTPVMPPPPAGNQEQGLPPPVSVELQPLEVAPLPAPVPSMVQPRPAARPAPAPRPGTPYTIRSGESLSAVAARNRMSWVKLAEYNRIVDPNKVRVGQVILIPPSGPAAPAASARPAPPPPPANRGNTYVVQSGDNLTVVARRHNTTVNDLKAANNLRSDRLLVGQILKLPAGSSTPTAAPPRSPAPVAAVPTPRPTPAPSPVRTSPEPEVVTPEPAPAPEAAEDPLVDKPFTIVVMEGDTLQSIASDYVVSVEKIREMNNLPANAELQPGQKLEMPPGLY